MRPPRPEHPGHPRPRPAPDLAAAAWLAGDVHVVRYGGPGLPVTLRIDLAPLPDGTDPTTAALDVLAGHTATPDDAYAAVWEGWGGEGPPAAPTFVLPDRRYLLLTGPVATLHLATQTWERPAGLFPPHLAWPADRAWCLACDVDEELAFSVGCSTAAAAAVERALPGVRRVERGAAEALYRD